MNNVLKATYIILISLGLAVVFNFLFFGKLIGISVFIFALLLLVALFWFGSLQQINFKKVGWLVFPILFFAVMPSIRASEFLSVLNVFTTLGLLILLANGVIGKTASFMRFYDYFLFALSPLRMLARVLSTFGIVARVHSSSKHRDMWIRIAKGVVMAVPLLVIFGALFSQSDLAFSQFINSFIDINISERTLQYIFLMVFAFVASLGFLSYVFFETKAEAVEKVGVPVPLGRGIEVLVFLGLVATLFAVFIGFQITYLFGGETNIVNAGFTYAEYARQGFWELLAVAILSLLMLLAAEKYSDNESKKDKRFLVPALILVAEVIVIIISAFKRLLLYIDAYSMTTLRFYVAGFIILLFALFILLAVKFMTSKREQFFTFGTLLSVIVFLVTVNLMNPDAFIARSNLEQYNRTGKIDVSHVGQLSADAESTKIELYEKLAGEDKNILHGFLINQRDELEKNNDHWQSANLARSQALKLLVKVNN